MPHTTINPAGLYNPVPFGYSHTTRVPAGAALVLVSGQWGSNTEGQLVAGGFAAQVQQAMHNLGVALAAHGLNFSHVAQLRTYVVNPDFERLGIIGQAVHAACGPVPPSQTLIGVASLAMPDMLFEIEAVAAH
jgi:enamine deaminase RidA (YjgF/YER057c/UK114 family)